MNAYRILVAKPVRKQPSVSMHVLTNKKVAVLVHCKIKTKHTDM
jgi:hypothetical protein